MHIIVFTASEIRADCKLLDNGVRNVFCKVWSESPMCYIFSHDYRDYHTVESAKTWCQHNSDFTVLLNRRITIFRKLNIYNSLIDWR